MSFYKKLNLRDEEKIVKVIRRYPLSHAWRYVLGLAFLLAAAFFTFWLLERGWWGLTLMSTGTLVGAVLIFHTWFFNHFTFFVITTERIIDVYRLGWLDEVTSSVRFKDVADVSARRSGLFGNIFNYGTLSVLTTTENLIIDVEKIHNPRGVQAEIIDMIEWSKTKKPASSACSADFVYGEFIKIIPYLSDAHLEHVTKLIDRQYEDMMETAISEE